MAMAKEPHFIHLPLCSKPLNKSYWLEGLTMYHISQFCTLSWAILLGLISASQDGAEVFHIALAVRAMAEAGFLRYPFIFQGLWLLLLGYHCSNLAQASLWHGNCLPKCSFPSEQDPFFKCL